MIEERFYRLCAFLLMLALLCAVAWSSAPAMAVSSAQQQQRSVQVGVDSTAQADSQQDAGRVEDTDSRDEPAPAAEAELGDPIVGVVTAVDGMAEWAEAGTSPLEDEGWTAIVVGDEFSSGTIIRTGLRSTVRLRFGEITYASVKSASLVSVDLCYRSETTETVRLGLGYGTVRGASSEGEVRSDVVVDAPMATLAKRGTDGWQMQAEAVTGKFTVSLAREGLVEAIAKTSRGQEVSRLVRPGEYATQDNVANMWFEQAVFDRNVQFFAVDGMTLGERGFANANDRGLGVLAPGAGSSIVDLSARVSASWTRDQIDRSFPSGTAPAFSGGTSPTPQTVVLLPMQRPEGNFGTGDAYRVNRAYQVLLPKKGGASR